MDNAMGAVGVLLLPLLIFSVYLVVVIFVIWAMLRIVRSLGEIATAQRAMAESIRKLADSPGGNSGN